MSNKIYFQMAVPWAMLIGVGMFSKFLGNEIWKAKIECNKLNFK